MRSLGVLLLFALILNPTTDGYGQAGRTEAPEPLLSFEQVPDSLWEVDPDGDAPYEVLQRAVTIRFLQRGERVVARILRHERIKVWSEEPSDLFQASWIAIPLPEEASIERVISLRGATRKRGVEPVRFGLEQMREGEVTRAQRVLEYSFPEVTSGAILDLEYEVERTYLEELPPLRLAETVPVREARVTLHNEPWLRYRSVMTGSPRHLRHLEVVRDTSQVPRIFTFERPEPVSTEYWVAEDLPASPDKPYAIPEADRLLTLHLQLSEWGWPRQPLLNSWAYVEAELRRGNADPWYTLDALDSLRSEGAAFRNRYDDPLERVEEMWRWFRERVIFNGEIRWVAESDPRQDMDGIPSDQAAINLAWTALVQGAGLEADPVLLPHRESGRLIDRFPSLSRFRQLVVRVRIGDESLWMDASLDHASPGIPRQEALGMVGWVLSRDSSSWETVSAPDAVNDLQILVTGRLEPEGDFIGELSLESRGYPAIEMREAARQREGVQELVRSLLSPRFGQLELSETSITTSLKSVRLHTPFQISGFALDEGNRLRFPPLMVGGLASHPLGDESRRDPVRLDAPERITLNVEVSLPNGIRQEEGEWSSRTGGVASRLEERYRQVNRELSYRIGIELADLDYRGGELLELLSIYERWLELTEEVWILEKL